jgi:hypothetical protein
MGRRDQTRMPRFWFCVLFVTIAACSSRPLCQDAHDYVPNLPYTAQALQTYTETEPDGTRVSRQEKLVKMRDSLGRTRIETPGVVNLYVPLQRQFIQLFPGRKTASVMIWDVPVPRHGDPNDKNIKRESLPGRTIHGIYCEGTRVVFLVPHEDGRDDQVWSVEETWVSPDLKIVLFHKNSDGTINEILELDRSEPDAALFEIPPDYKIVK